MTLLQQIFHMITGGIIAMMIGVFTLLIDMVVYDIVKQILNTKKLLEYFNEKSSQLHGALMRTHKNNY